MMLFMQVAFQLKCPMGNWQVKQVTELVDMNLREKL